MTYYGKISNVKKRKIALFDIDGTIYEGKVIFPLAEYQLKEGTINKSCLDKLYNDSELYKSGRVNYEILIANLLIHWAKGLKGGSYNMILKQTKRFFGDKGNKFFPFLKPILILLEKTYDIYFVTGEPQFVAKAVFELFKIKGIISSELEVKDGVFTGRVRSFLAKHEEKQTAIKELLESHHLKHSFAFGNAEGDIEMLNSVDFPICINPTPGLREIAIRRNWQIVKPGSVEKIVSILLANAF